MSSSVDCVDCVVIGAGVVGLAIARALACEQREVWLLEAQGAIGTQISARNSEVIHGGMYYPTNSLKAKLCVQGNALMYEYCEQRGVPHRKCGKFIVATELSQIATLQKLQEQAVANGIFDLEMLEGAQAKRAEPALACVAALHSPSTGIVDAASLMLALLGDFEHAGGTLALHTVVVNGCATGAGIELVTQDGTRLLARHVINAAGLGAIPLARQLQGIAQSQVPSSYFAKGNYFSLAGRSPFGRLIYPVPQHAGLGVHLTLDLGGQVRFGPDVQWVDSPDDLMVDPDRARGFYASIRSYWPGLPDDSLVPAYAGIRPKISGPDSASADFCIQGSREHGVSGLVQLFGIESPGLTSSLAIGNYVRDLLNQADC